MSAIRYWVWDLRPDECESWDFYECDPTRFDAAMDAKNAETVALSIGGRPVLYHGDISADHWRLLLAAIAAPTEADVRGLS